MLKKLEKKEKKRKEKEGRKGKHKEVLEAASYGMPFDVCS